MKEKRLVDANHFMQVLKNIEYALKGELTHGKIKTSVVQMIEGSLNAEPTIAPESLQPLTYNENRDYIDCDEFMSMATKFRFLGLPMFRQTAKKRPKKNSETT